MSYAAECPICKVTLSFPDVSPADPVCCPVCKSRFMLAGRNAAHLAFTDYYSLLDVSDRAGQDELRKAIRAKILEHHPDHNPDDPGATDRLRKVIEAREMLGDPSKRRIYDSVYHAQTLPVWSGRSSEPAHPRPGRIPRPAPPSPYEDRRPPKEESAYEEMYTKAQATGKSAQDQNIDHLISEIEAILSSREATSAKQAKWGLTGAIIFGTAAFLIGLGMGRPAGALILGLLGAGIGWMLGSNAGVVVSLIFLSGRLLLAGYILAPVASAATLPGGGTVHALDIVTGPVLMAIAGGFVFGLARMGTGALAGRRRVSLRFEAMREGVWGAWIGAMIAMGVMYVSHSRDMEPALMAWFFLFSFYLLIDYWIFCRPWVFIR
jgi:hypothetical protein